MLAQEEQEVHALKRREWPSPAIAHYWEERPKSHRRGYVGGEERPVRERRRRLIRSRPCASVAVDDPHVWASALFHEVVTPGYLRVPVRTGCRCSAAVGDEAEAFVHNVEERAAFPPAAQVLEKLNC